MTNKRSRLRWIGDCPHCGHNEELIYVAPHLFIGPITGRISCKAICSSCSNTFYSTAIAEDGTYIGMIDLRKESRHPWHDLTGGWIRIEEEG